MATVPKPVVLLAAYEELTEKESFCIKEGNMEGCLRLQKKKAKLLGELQQVSGDLLAGGELADYQARIERLQLRESENAEALALLIDENRASYRGLSKQSGSAAKFRKVYANPLDKKVVRNKLEGQA